MVYQRVHPINIPVDHHKIPLISQLITLKSFAGEFHTFFWCSKTTKIPLALARLLTVQSKERYPLSAGGSTARRTSRTQPTKRRKEVLGDVTEQTGG